MIKAEQVPPEAYAAAAELLAEGARTDQAIAAALNAWPGMLSDGDLIPAEYGPPLHLVNTIILPLQESSDE